MPMTTLYAKYIDFPNSSKLLHNLSEKKSDLNISFIYMDVWPNCVIMTVLIAAVKRKIITARIQKFSFCNSSD